jgi:hypothetical protein
VANKLNNDHHGGMWFWISWAFTSIPIFTFIGLVSKNILFDSVLYDVIILIAYVITLLIMGCGTAFNIWNWVGLALTVAGFLLMKVTV